MLSSTQKPPRDPWQMKELTGKFGHAQVKLGWAQKGDEEKDEKKNSRLRYEWCSLEVEEKNYQ